MWTLCTPPNKLDNIVAFTGWYVPWKVNPSNEVSVSVTLHQRPVLSCYILSSSSCLAVFGNSQPCHMAIIMYLSVCLSGCFHDVSFLSIGPFLSCVIWWMTVVSMKTELHDFLSIPTYAVRPATVAGG